MAQLALASLVFVALHILPALSLRDELIRRIGDPAYMALFSLASVLGLAWMIAAYNGAPAGGALWTTGPAVRWASAIAMLFAFILVVSGATTRNPTSILGKGALKPGEQWTGIFAITRHPLMWGTALWAVLHLLNRPDARSALFFGALGLLAIAGTLRQEVRKSAEHGKAWQQFASQTSYVPFAALLAGRAKLRLRDLGGWRLAGAAALWLVALYFHRPLIGVSPVPL